MDSRTQSQNLSHINDEYDYLFKIVLIGDCSVGKTNLISRYVLNKFVLNSTSTVGVEFCEKIIKNLDSVVKAQIWDTSGQEKYSEVAKIYFKGAVGAMLTYDVTNRTSFENLDKWALRLKENAQNNVVIMLVGNKADVDEEKPENKQINEERQERQVQIEEGKKYAQTNSYGFMETSAKSGNNVDAAFNQLVQRICEVLSNEQKKEMKEKKDQLKENKKKQKKSNCCDT